MPSDSTKCPKCGGDANQYEKEKFRCSKCGYEFSSSVQPETLGNAGIDSESTGQPKGNPIGWIILIVILGLAGAALTYKMVTENQGGSDVTTQPSAH